MKQIKLTPIENYQLVIRGFVVRNAFAWEDFFSELFNILLYIGSLIMILGVGHILLSGLLYILLGVNGAESIYETIVLFLFVVPIFIMLFILPIFNSMQKIMSLGKIFISEENGILDYSHLLSGRGLNNISFLSKISEGLKNINTSNSGKRVEGLIIIPILVLFLYPKWSFIFAGLFLCIIYLGKGVFHKLHPLYAFGNLGEKIQKLTPQIEEQSKNIQSEFESTMDFSVLSHGFDSLSRNFSEIVQLIIKLENAEKGANKGNLFDSQKYINSLRSDIAIPLISLKAFLEENKIELIQSKQELTRMQVGGSEKTGNIELQSKRSDPLILELTENIEKLDMMIGKMG